MSRRIYAVVPVKDLRESKTRLSNVLDQEAREKLTLLMFEDVVSALKNSRLLTGVIVVTPSQDVLNLGKSLGCKVIKEGASGVGLNKAVELGIKFSEELGAESVVIMPADIPLIDSEDVNRLILAGLRLEKPYVVISPSRNGGTNALLLSLPPSITPRFGVNSYTLHLHEAKKVRSNLLIFRSKRISLDIDSYGDILSSLKEAEGGKGKKSISYLRSYMVKRAIIHKELSRL